MKAHRTDTLSLVFGLIFLLFSFGYLATAYLNLELPEVGWFIAGGLIFIGIVGAVTALIPSRQTAEQPAPVAEAPEGQDPVD